MKKLLSTSEFASAIGISESSVRRLADSGIVSIQRTKGGHRKIPVEEAIRYVRAEGIQLENPNLLGITPLAASDSEDAYCEALFQGDGDLAGAQPKFVMALCEMRCTGSASDFQ